jgi:hypothetical protein
MEIQPSPEKVLKGLEGESGAYVRGRKRPVPEDGQDRPRGPPGLEEDFPLVGPRPGLVRGQDADAFANEGVELREVEPAGIQQAQQDAPTQRVAGRFEKRFEVELVVADDEILARADPVEEFVRPDDAGDALFDRMFILRNSRYTIPTRGCQQCGVTSPFTNARDHNLIFPATSFIILDVWRRY